MPRRSKNPSAKSIGWFEAALLCIAFSFSVIKHVQADDTTSPDTPVRAGATDPASTELQTNPDTEPVPEPKPKPGLTVRELLVLQTDRYGDIANQPGEVNSTLFVPIRHTGRIKLQAPPDTYARTAMPLGLISFEGAIKEPLRVRLDLLDDEAFFHAHWPNDAVKGERSIEWYQVAESSRRQAPSPMDLRRHWLGPLRDAEDRLWLSTRHPILKERFMLYDASLPFKSSLELQPQQNGYRLINTAPERTPPLTLLLSLKDDRWRMVQVGETWDKPGETTIQADVFNAEPAEAGEAKTSPLLPIANWLSQQGYNREEVITALKMVASSGMEKSSMSLVYIMPEGEINDHLWLRFKPEPDRVIRTTIVVVNNVDPDLGTRLDELIAGLGDERWPVRERSQRELEALGLAAIRKVQAAKNSEDPEIAFRARQILDAYDLRQEALAN